LRICIAKSAKNAVTVTSHSTNLLASFASPAVPGVGLKNIRKERHNSTSNGIIIRLRFVITVAEMRGHERASSNTSSQDRGRTPRNILNDIPSVSRARSTPPASSLPKSSTRIAGAQFEVQQTYGLRSSNVEAGSSRNPEPFGSENGDEDSDSDDTNPELQRDESVPLLEIPLTLQVKSAPNVFVWIWLTLTTVWTSFSVYYVWNAGVTSNPSPRFLWERPDYTIFTVGLLSFISTVLINKLISETCEQLRWNKCCKRNGMSFLSFLALSSGTSFERLVHLSLSPFPPASFQRLRTIEHRIWSLQRYIFNLCF
jgi:hypothetical protein